MLCCRCQHTDLLGPLHRLNLGHEEVGTVLDICRTGRRHHQYMQQVGVWQTGHMLPVSPARVCAVSQITHD
jgi:hypothetical protein